MFLRMYNTSDCEFLAELFYQTVHNVNAKDYGLYKCNKYWRNFFLYRKGGTVR